MYKRIGIVDLSILKDLGGFKNEETHISVLGVNVKRKSQRYSLFKRSTKCSACGIKGSYFAVEKNQPDSITMNYHLNLYAIDNNGNEILMTKDHIIPKSKGGKDILKNYQTMCYNCNQAKGNK